MEYYDNQRKEATVTHEDLNDSLFCYISCTSNKLQ